MLRMKKMAPEVTQIISNYHYEIKEETKATKKEEAKDQTKKDVIDEEILTQKILDRVKVSNELNEYVLLLNRKHALAIKLLELRT